mgnify:CR=1 FL=1
MPPGTTVYAVGDVHGQMALLEQLIDRIRNDASRQPGQRQVIVFVGDYIDRGPESAAVIDYLIRGLSSRFEAHCLMGNHEHALLRFLCDPTALPHWLMNGAAATLQSYGVEPVDEAAGEEAFTSCRDALLAAMPASHRAFFDSLPLTVEIGDYLFVHAGIRPGIPVAEQSTHDLLWIREGFLDCKKDLGPIVVHGHTPHPEPVVMPNRIGIDTGAWAYGCLTALRLEGTARTFMQVRMDEIA